MILDINLSKLEDLEDFGKKAINSTRIQQFYENQVIFITGGTGFLGKVLIEKLSRCCTDITRIYVLVRQKKGKDIQERIQDLLNDTFKQPGSQYSITHKELLHLLNLLPEDKINDMTSQIFSPWPNTYTFTKALAEDLIRNESQHLPIGIFRPEIAAHEPIPGWTDNYNGPTGIIAGAASGIMRTLHVNSAKLTNLVPVDFTANALTASAWDVSTQTNRKIDDMLIYNFTSTSEAPLSWDMFERHAGNSLKEYPSEIATCYLIMQTTKYKFLYTIYAFFLHYLPGLFLDFFARITGRTPRLQKA